MQENQQLAIVPQQAMMLPEFSTFEGILSVAKTIADSGMFGCKTPAQAATLMLLAQAEGQHPFAAMRKWHLIDGRPSMKAEAMIAEMKAKTTGGLIWHVRNDSMAGATFFEDRTKIDEDAQKRAAERFVTQWKMDMHKDNPKVQAEATEKLASLSRMGEVTVIRYAMDEFEKGVSSTTKNNEKVLKDNWAKSPRQMLTARVSSEGVRLVASGVVVGIYSTEEEQDMLQDRLMLPSPKKTREDIEKEITKIREQALNASDDDLRKKLLATVAQLQYELEQMEPPATVIDGKLEVVSEPEPKPAKTIPKEEKQTEATEVSETQTTDPFPEPKAEPTKPANSSGLPDEIANHRVEFVALSGIKGKIIGELSAADVKRVKMNWVEKYAEKIASASDGRKTEAKRFLEAFRFHESQGAYK